MVLIWKSIHDQIDECSCDATHVKTVSHVAIKIMEYPKMDTNRKFLRSSCVFPMRCMSCWSFEVPLFSELTSTSCDSLSRSTMSASSFAGMVLTSAPYDSMLWRNEMDERKEAWSKRPNPQCNQGIQRQEQKQEATLSKYRIKC